MRKALPILLLAALVFLLAWWIWPRAAAWHHGRTVFRLTREHREKEGPAWPEPDAERLWGSIVWFRWNRPEGLHQRILDSLLSADPVERESALVLASELVYYEGYPGLLKSYGPSLYPYPRVKPTGMELAGLKVAPLVQANADVFARASDGIPERGQLSYLYLHLLQVSPTARGRKAVEDIAAGTGTEDLRMEALSLLDGHPAAPSTIDLLRGFRKDSNPRLRLAAAAALARLSDPQGTADFVEALSLPHPEIPAAQFEMHVARMRGPFCSLEDDFIGPVIHYFHEDWRQAAALPCDLREPWEAWLRLRESEGFAPEPQEARNRAFREQELLGLR